MDHLERSRTLFNEPSTPITRVSVHPKHNHVIHCVIGFKNPIDVTTLKDELSNSVMIKIPRFSSLLVVDSNGTEYWKITDNVNLDDHIFIHDDDDDDDDDDDVDDDGDDDAINSYLAEIALSPPMKLDKPLWELHIMRKHKCSILRVHHAIADGMSLMSLLWTMGSNSSILRVRDGKQLHHDPQHHPIVMANKNDQGFRKKGSFLKRMGLWEGLMYIWVTFVLVLKFIGRSLWVKDKKSVISGIEGVELWPRKVVTAKFQISDMKTIKNAIPNATVNDVLYGIIWCGLIRYLNIRHPHALQDEFQFTGLCPINLREQPGVLDAFSMISKNSGAPWGNRFAMVLLPITYFKRDLNALAYIARAKAVMDRKKRSMEARLCYDIGYLLFSWFGSKVGGDLFYNLFTHTSFLMSNIAGPPEAISLAGNPITFIRATSSAQPHAFTLHMVSYAGKANLQIQVAKEVIPDPEFLATCFENALHEMKEAANAN